MNSLIRPTARKGLDLKSRFKIPKLEILPGTSRLIVPHCIEVKFLRICLILAAEMAHIPTTLPLEPSSIELALNSIKSNVRQTPLLTSLCTRDSDFVADLTEIRKSVRTHFEVGLIQGCIPMRGSIDDPKLSTVRRIRAHNVNRQDEVQDSELVLPINLNFDAKPRNRLLVVGVQG